MINATKKWIFLKVSGTTLVPLMLWFVINLITIYDQGYLDVVDFLQIQLLNFYLTYLLSMHIFFQR